MKLRDTQIFASGGLPLYYSDLRFGIELEFERGPDQWPNLEYWDCVRDPSLRNNGVEFVSAPLGLRSIKPALKEVQEEIDKYGLHASWRCGGHTHINVSYWTWGQLINHLTLYTLMEPWIFANWAPGRENNHFCVPMWANTRLVDFLVADAEILRSNREVMARNLNMHQCCKYSALNLAPILKQGTIEYRHLPATRDMQEIRKWCGFLVKLVKLSHIYEVPEKIVQDYEDVGANYFLRKLQLEEKDVHQYDVEDAYASANLMVGFDPVEWQDLDWDLPNNRRIERKVDNNFIRVGEVGVMNMDLDQLMRARR